jgi:hypothetical protein
LVCHNNFVDSGPRALILASGLATLKVILRFCLEEILEICKSGNESSLVAIKQRLDALDACGLILETIIEDGKITDF